MALVKRVLEQSGLTRSRLARDSELSEDALWAWVSDRRSPSPESLVKLAEGLEKRGGELTTLAAELREAAGGES